MKIIRFIAIAMILSSNAQGQCACCAGAGTGSTSGDYNNGVLTLEKKQFVIESYGDYRTIKTVAEDIPGSGTTDEEVPLKAMLIGSVGIRYGITDKITLSALLPYAFLYTDKGNDRGMGDLMFLATFNVLSKRNFNFALQGGIELPTGIQKGANFDNTTVVVGSGSFDPMFGLVFSKKWERLTVQGNGLFKYTTRGFDDTNFGSLSVQSLSVVYRLAGENQRCNADSIKHTDHSIIGLTVSGGYYGEWLDKINRISEGKDENTGYYLGFATVGANVSIQKWNIPLTLSLPLIQGMNGTQNNAGLRFRIGLVKYF